jgi:hypothetical protein
MHQGGAKAMNDIQLSKFLGWFSLGLGTLELLASRRVATKLGVGSPGLVQAFGAREIAAGFMVLNKPDTAMPVWGRVVGDAMDAAVLATRLGSGNPQRGGAKAALLFVLGATALDVVVAAALSRREQQALITARRTRAQSRATQTIGAASLPQAVPVR